VEPGGDARWDEPPLDVQIPDDARELERDVLAYRRELRAAKRKRRLRRFLPTQAGIMPLIASILAVCLVAGMMLSVFTISPTDSPSKTHSPGVKATTQPASPRPSSRPASSHSPASATPTRTPPPR
jgi:cytoskeletal protein RodZ